MPNPETTWLTVKGAADRALCGTQLIYREVKAGRLRAARIGGRRELRLKPAWVDEWLEKASTVVEVQASADRPREAVIRRVAS